jgi:serine/threonine protein kinase
MKIIKFTESFKKADGKYKFTHLNLILRKDNQLYFAKGLHRQPELCLPELYDMQLLQKEDRGPKVQSDWLVLSSDYKHDYYVKTPDLWSYAKHISLEQQILREVEVCEKLRYHPHPNIAFYGGCHSINGRVTGICYKRYTSTLQQKLNPGSLCKSDFLHNREHVDDISKSCLDGVLAGIKHLHSLGLIHNDITPSNIMFDTDGTPVIIDFDSCRKVGVALNDTICGTKRTYGWHDPEIGIATERNDLDAFAELRTWLVGVSKDEFLFRGG